MSCIICIENYNKSNKVVITCEFCEFSCCRECCQKYVVDSTDHPHCMNCKREWTREILIKKFPKSFINGPLKSRRQELLLERERALLPATQPAVEFQIKKEQTLEKIKSIKHEIAKLTQELYSVQIDYHNLLRDQTESYKKSNFVKKCPNQNCRGFLDSNFKCSLCFIMCCKRCHEITGETSHVCNDQTVETIKLLKSDSKPCPQCGVFIFKIEGCSQMFCMNCHTPFDWETGRLENGTIHNPHYFEWLRENGTGQIARNPNDIICGREIDNFFINQLIGRGNELGIYKNDYTKSKEINHVWRHILTICQSIIHNRLVELPKFIPDIITDNESLRIKYLRNQITEAQFKFQLQKKEKASQKNREISNVLGMFCTTSTEIMFRLMHELSIITPTDLCMSDKIIRSFLKEFINLKKYTDNCFKTISTVYNCKIYSLDTNFKLI